MPDTPAPELNPYAPPQATVADTTEANSSAFFTTSKTKLAVLFVATFGVYVVYWFYKQWQAQKPFMDKNIILPMRAVFNVFFTVSLFKRIEAGREHAGVPIQWQPTALAIVYIAIMVVSNGMDRVAIQSEVFGAWDAISMVLTLLAMYPLLVAQGIANAINGDPLGETNSGFSGWNWVFIVVGGLIWLVMLTAVAMQFVV